MEPADLYADVRARVTDLVGDLPVERLATPVPGCPAWTVHDVVAHLAGTTADVNSGNLDGVTTDRWTGAQVAARRGRSIGELLAEWAANAVTLEPNLNTFPKGMSRLMVIDVVTHEQDIRGALGEPGGRDCEAYAVARKGYGVALSKKLDEHGLPGLRLVADDWEFEAGPEPRATVRTADSFEFFRALSGRRGVKQVLAFDWSTDPTPYLAVFNRFGPLPDEDVVEP